MDVFGDGLGTAVSIFADVHRRPILTGMLSCIVWLIDWWRRGRPLGNAVSAEFCRAVWCLHLKNLQCTVDEASLRPLGELGLGAKLGACIAALRDGVEIAIALDASNYQVRVANVKILSELNDEGIQSHAPSELYGAVGRAGTDNESRLRCLAPWSDHDVLDASSFVLIDRDSVLEQVDQPLTADCACFRWLRAEGRMSQKIDHCSHRIAQKLNGYYLLPAGLWMVKF